MEMNGIKVQPSRLKELETTCCPFKGTGREDLQGSREEFNPNSPKQLGIILFEKAGLPVIKKTKTGYSTSVEVLNQLKEQARCQ